MMINFSPRIRGIKNGILLLSKGHWGEFLIRIRICLGHIDLIHDPSEMITERTHYYADSGGMAFDKLMSHFTVTPEDALVDFGCGKGGILISASKYPFSKITGVEISGELAHIAKENLRKLKLWNTDVQCCDASQFVDLDDYTYFYFFDPFPCVVMKDVLFNIERSLESNPRKVTIIYLNPFCHDLIESSRTFRKVQDLPHFEHQCFVYSNAG